jgi:hypothetical protein
MIFELFRVVSGRGPMTKVIAIGAGLLLALSIVSTASAEGGCGIGYHRGPYGGCRPNGGAVVVGVPGVGVVVAPRAVAPRACPVGYHLGPEGRRCWPN